MMLLIAAIFCAVAILETEARRESAIAAIILITAALLAIPALVRLFMSFTGDEEILANGFVGSATITSLKPTAWRYNRQYPITRFQLKSKLAARAIRSKSSRPSLRRCFNDSPLEPS
jgi:hypothetical protein